MDKLQYQGLRWETNDVCYHEEKNGIPKKAFKDKVGNYIQSENGSYITRQPNALVLLFSDGANTFRVDITREVYAFLGRTKSGKKKPITKKIRNKIDEYFKELKEFEAKKKNKNTVEIYGVQSSVRFALGGREIGLFDTIKTKYPPKEFN